MHKYQWEPGTLPIRRANHLCMRVGPLGIRIMLTTWFHTEGHRWFFVIQWYEAEDLAKERRFIKRAPRIFRRKGRW